MAVGELTPAVEYVDGRPILAGYDPVDPDVFENLAAWMAVAREIAPAFYVPAYDEWVVVRAEDCERVMNDPTSFTNKFTVQLPPPPEELSEHFPYGRFALAETVAVFDPPEHLRLRRRILPAFARKQALLKRSSIREIADRMLDQVIDRGSADLAKEWCHRIPVRVIAELLAIPEEWGTQLHEWAIQLVILSANPTLPQETRLEYALKQVEFERYVTEVVSDRRRNPKGEDDFVTNLLHATDSDGQPDLSDREVVVLVTNTIYAGSDTSATSLAEILEELLKDRSRWEDLVAHPELIDNAVEEGLRLRGPVRGSIRTSIRDVEIGGVTIPSGSTVRPHIWSANRDERRYADPERFDLRRDNARKQMAFGFGPHICPGQHLAREEIRVCLETLVERLPSVRLRPESKLEIAPHMMQAVVQGGLLVEWDERS